MKFLTQKQQLEIIEGLTLSWENMIRQDLLGAKKVINDIYTIAHLNGSCENTHLDWHKKGFRLGRKLKKLGMCNFTE